MDRGVQCGSPMTFRHSFTALCSSTVAVSLACVIGATGCSGQDSSTGSTGDDEGALTVAQNDYALAMAEFNEDLSDREHGEDDVDGLQTASVKLQSLDAAVADACAALGPGIKKAHELPIFFAFGGGDVAAAALVGVDIAHETSWDLTHRQVSLFDGREEYIGGDAEATAGVYGGLGLIDLSVVRKHGDPIPTNVINGWTGSYFGVELDIDVPFKFAWASTSCVTDKPGAFFACSLNGGIGISTDLIPLSGDVLKGEVKPNDERTLAFANRVKVPHQLAKSEADGETPSHSYVQLLPLQLTSRSKVNKPNVRSALSLTRTMPVALASVAGPLAIALGVDADLKASHGVGLIDVCAKN